MCKCSKCNCIYSAFVTNRITDIKTSFRLLDTTVCVGDTAVFYIKPDAKDVETADWLYTTIVYFNINVIPTFQTIHYFMYSIIEISTKL